MELKDLRTGLFGFNKNDVCEYISQLNSIYEQKDSKQKEEQREKLEELSRKNEELGNNASFLNQENTELKRKAEALQNKVDSFSRETEELKNQLMQMHKSIALVLSDIENQFALAEDKILKLQNAQSSENENDNKK